MAQLGIDRELERELSEEYVDLLGIDRELERKLSEECGTTRYRHRSRKEIKRGMWHN